MGHYFTIDQARTRLPELQQRVRELQPVRAELAQRVAEHRGGGAQALPEIKSLEARLSELLDDLSADGVQVKGWAPVLLDFPMRYGDRELLLCWIEGEPELAWYHDAEHGFAGRRPIADLE